MCVFLFFSGLFFSKKKHNVFVVPCNSVFVLYMIYVVFISSFRGSAGSLWRLNLLSIRAVCRAPLQVRVLHYRRGRHSLRHPNRCLVKRNCASAVAFFCSFACRRQEDLIAKHFKQKPFLKKKLHDFESLVSNHKAKAVLGMHPD